MMALDSVNFVFGRTLNPGGRGKWTAGGSSGGEGVLVAMRGCVFGVGTDVGGSVRIPASVNGVVGFKPSVGRVPNKGCQTGRLPANGAVGVESCAGVLARGVEDVGTFLECVEEARAWEVDAGVLPGRWWSAEEGLAGRRPRIGVLWDDGVVVPLPPVKRVLADVVERLRGSGIEVVEVQPGRLGECQNLANKLFGIEGGAHLWSLLDRTGEPLIPWLQGKMKRGMPQSIDALRDLCARRDELRDAMAGAFWRDGNGHGGLDAVVLAVAPHPVPGIDRWGYVGYTGAFNLLDWPAGCLPVGVGVGEGDLGVEVGEEVGGGWDLGNRALCEFFSFFFCCFGLLFGFFCFFLP